MFDEYANIIQQEYPEITIHGSNYDPPGMNMFLARLIVSTKLFFYVCTIDYYLCIKIYVQCGKIYTTF